MSIIRKQLVVNSFKLPKEIIDIIIEYTFRKIRKISTDDIRFSLLYSIPIKYYSDIDDITYTYLRIANNKE